MTEQTACPNCSHPQHLPGTECETRIDHGPSRFHLCLCLARPGAANACPPQMTCQGGTLGYADIWYLQQGHSLSSEDGVISPEVLTTGPASVGFPSQAPAVPAGQAPDADRDTLRDRIAALFRHPPGAERLGDATPGEIADAVLSVLPASADRAGVEAERDSLGREADRLRKDWVEMRTRAERAEQIQKNADFHLGQEMARRQLAEKENAQLRADRAAVFDAAARHLYTALFPAVYADMGQKAAEGVNRAVSELRRMADEAGSAVVVRRATDETQGEARPRCPHCQLPHDLEADSTAVAACASIRASIASGTQAADEPQFGVPGCTCRPWTRQEDPPRYLDQPGDTVDMISGWEIGSDCPHHKPAVGAQQPTETRP